jgi:hypothetical protein
VAEPLLSVLQQFHDDPSGFEKRLKGRCVLLYDPPEQRADSKAEDESTFRFRTASGESDMPLGGGEPQVVYLEKTKDNAFQRRITLGRTANNEVVIESNSVSRFHAWFEQDAGGDWTLADAGSKNGTALSGEKLTPRKPMSLANGNKVRVGMLELTFLTPSGFLKLLKGR